MNRTKRAICKFREVVQLRRKLSRPRTTAPMAVDAKQHVALLVIAPPEVGNVLTALWTTGAKATELLSCERRHVIDDGDRMRLVKEEKLHRFIYVPPRTAAMIRSLIAVNGDGPVFRNSSGEAMTASTFRNSLLRLNRIIGTNVTINGYRRSVAMRLMQLGVCLDVIHEILGQAHRHVLYHYVAMNQAPIWEAVELLESAKPE